MRQYMRVYYYGAEWSYIQTIGDKYLLRSTNKNIDDVLAEMEHVIPTIKEDGQHAKPTYEI